MLAGPFVGLPVLLLASKILWINLLTHGLTGVAMGAEPVDPENMKWPPRPPTQSILTAGLWQRVLRLSVVVGAAALGIGVWSSHTQRARQSMLFLSLTSLGLRTRMWTRQNRFLPAAVATSMVLALAGIYLPALRYLLETVRLPRSDSALAASVGNARLDSRSRRPAPVRSDANARASPGSPALNEPDETGRQRHHVIPALGGIELHSLSARQLAVISEPGTRLGGLRTRHVRPCDDCQQAEPAAAVLRCSIVP